ncbi:MAG TPA: prenyltransferase/squalene oxidase repeat-containing protein [Nannocystaceae bacterium]|nr:prenyltransferase/squalene oxidase repeat-containing protein [Nannocystaceae bacterium]
MDGATRSESPPRRARVESAIARARAAVCAEQRDDGSWRGNIDAGPLFTAVALALEHALGVLRPHDAIAGVRRLRAAQLADGGIAAWPGADRSSHEATSFWLAGMHAGGVAKDDPALLAARRFLAAGGGLNRNLLIVRVVLAAAGVLDPRELPPIPLAYKLVPGHESVLARFFGVNALVPLHTLPALAYALRRGHVGPSRASARVIDYLSARQDESGSLAGVPFYTMLMALVLRRFGVPEGDDRIVRAIAFARRTWSWDEHGLHVGPFHCESWDTAHALRGLGDDHAAIDRGLAWLVATQSRGPAPRDWQTPPRDAPRHGGWSWQSGNARNPDIDTTAVVLAALARHDSWARGDVRHAVRTGADWLRALQNPDGGFAAFSHGKRTAPLGALHLPRAGLRDRIARWLAEHGDPSSADVTGRVLQGLGAVGHRRGELCIDRAVTFLARHQLGDGSWWGRWAIAYLPATSYIVSGLVAVGVDPRSRMVQRALQWLRARQNRDGGFGETPDAFADPRRAGQGPSSVQVTSIVTIALCDAGLGTTATVTRAIDWLLAHQRDDGRWDDDACYGVIFPHRYYYRSDAFPTHMALEALHAHAR